MLLAFLHPLFRLLFSFQRPSFSCDRLSTLSCPPSPVNTFFLLKNSSAISFCRHRSGQLLYLNRFTMSRSFFRSGSFCCRPEIACAFSGAHLSTKPGPACQYLFSSERAFSRPASPAFFLRCARGTFIPILPSLVNTFVQVFPSCISKTWVAEPLTVQGQCASYNYTLKNDFWRGNICNA